MLKMANEKPFFILEYTYNHYHKTVSVMTVEAYNFNYTVNSKKIVQISGDYRPACHTWTYPNTYTHTLFRSYFYILSVSPSV